MGTDDRSFIASQPAVNPQRISASHTPSRRAVRTKPSFALTPRELADQNHRFAGTGGRSEENCHAAFRPAFLDRDTSQVYESRFADGRPAPIHLLDGLPDEVVVARTTCGRVLAVKESVIAGFVRAARFYSREEAAAALSLSGA
ncbi:MAG: hypothetical protein ROZ37_12970 [Aromatoleum sp.]|jgi:hypothetical protein|uniref:hypothetical protein n=1 Tax=Aromatoleum sp. TaxID=2307007 RepID=UPI002894DEC9|nr:hypothetical protein [Aromatoleum sp.]MDT3671228.1 hypothetical protein [Aromatoleum sp.]